jgi:chromosome segregation ATPase
MSHKKDKKVFIERDRHGRERLVLSGGERRRSSSSERGTGELLSAAHAQIESLQTQIGQLQTRLSFEQSNQWNSRRETERLTADNFHLQGQLEVQIQEVRRLEDSLYHEEKKNDKLEEKYRNLKRNSSGSRRGSSEYKRAYEEKAQEVEVLRVRLAERDDLIRLDEARIAEKNQLLRDKNSKIAYFKDYLRSHGFRVED